MLQLRINRGDRCGNGEYTWAIQFLSRSISKVAAVSCWREREIKTEALCETQGQWVQRKDFHIQRSRNKRVELSQRGSAKALSSRFSKGRSICWWEKSFLHTEARQRFQKSREKISSTAGGRTTSSKAVSTHVCGRQHRRAHLGFWTTSLLKAGRVRDCLCEKGNFL